MWGLDVLFCVVGAFHCGVRIALCCFVLCCFVGAGIVDSLSITRTLSSVQLGARDLRPPKYYNILGHQLSTSFYGFRMDKSIPFGSE